MGSNNKLFAFKYAVDYQKTESFLERLGKVTIIYDEKIKNTFETDFDVMQKVGYHSTTLCVYSLFV